MSIGADPRLPFHRYRGGGRTLLGIPSEGDGSSRHGYGIPVFAECGTTCAYCNRELAAPYEAWLNFSVDHVVPTNTVKLGYNPKWVADLANLVTCCRACNEFLNQYKVLDPPPVTLEEFFALRDRHFVEKRRWVLGRHERERERYQRWFTSTPRSKEIRRLAADPTDREEMRLIRERMSDIRPFSRV